MKTRDLERNIVTALGEQIGYGNMMSLSSEAWRSRMEERGFSVSGVLVPVLPCDIKEEARQHYGVAGESIRTD